MDCTRPKHRLLRFIVLMSLFVSLGLSLRGAQAAGPDADLEQRIGGTLVIL